MIDWVGQDGDWYENCTWGECADCVWPRTETQYRKYMCNVRQRLDNRQEVDLHSQRRRRSVELLCIQKTWREATIPSFLFVPLCESYLLGRIGLIEVECNCYNPTTLKGCNSKKLGPKETASESRFFVEKWQPAAECFSFFVYWVGKPHFNHCTKWVPNQSSRTQETVPYCSPP